MSVEAIELTNHLVKKTSLETLDSFAHSNRSFTDRVNICLSWALYEYAGHSCELSPARNIFVRASLLKMRECRENVDSITSLSGEGPALLQHREWQSSPRYIAVRSWRAGVHMQALLLMHFYLGFSACHFSPNAPHPALGAQCACHMYSSCFPRIGQIPRSLGPFCARFIKCGLV